MVSEEMKIKNVEKLNINLFDLDLVLKLSEGYSVEKIAEYSKLPTGKILTRILTLRKTFKCNNVPHLVATFLRKGIIK